MILFATPSAHLPCIITRRDEMLDEHGICKLEASAKNAECIFAASGTARVKISICKKTIKKIEE